MKVRPGRKGGREAVIGRRWSSSSAVRLGSASRAAWTIASARVSCFCSSGSAFASSCLSLPAARSARRWTFTVTNCSGCGTLLTAAVTMAGAAERGEALTAAVTISSTSDGAALTAALTMAADEVGRRVGAEALDGSLDERGGDRVRVVAAGNEDHRDISAGMGGIVCRAELYGGGERARGELIERVREPRAW